MRTNLDNNKISADFLTVQLDSFVQSDTFILKSIRRNFAYKDGKKTDIIESIGYEVVDPQTFANFRLKVPGNAPVIEPDEFEKSENILKISIPLSKTLVRPYKLEYGSATVSITAPFVELA